MTADIDIPGTPLRGGLDVLEREGCLSPTLVE